MGGEGGLGWLGWAGLECGPTATFSCVPSGAEGWSVAAY